MGRIGAFSFFQAADKGRVREGWIGFDVLFLGSRFAVRASHAAGHISVWPQCRRALRVRGWGGLSHDFTDAHDEP